MDHLPINQSFVAELVPAQLLDQLWATGWRHFGTHFFRYSQLETNHVRPLRIDLKQFAQSASQKRVLKRNSGLELRIQPAVIDDQKRHLFALHRLRFEHNIPPKLETFLHPEPSQTPCETLELCIYAQGQLVGAHFLDVGHTASSSVYSIYDPAHSRHSLGIYLMLLAIEHSLHLGKTHYYPGYAYLEPSKYDYKKRFLGLETYDWHRWQAAGFRTAARPQQAIEDEPPHPRAPVEPPF